MNQALESEDPTEPGEFKPMQGIDVRLLLAPASQQPSAEVLYETDALWCVSFSGKDASEALLKVLYSTREASYRTHLKGSTSTATFDPKDKSYSHVLIVSKLDGTISAGMRLMPSPREGLHSVPEDSYLEYSYPGFYSSFAERGSFLELSRLFFSVDADAKAKGWLFTAIYRGIRSLAESISCEILVGLTSYNHFIHKGLSNRYFLTSMNSPAFFETVDVPAPRYPLDIDLTLSAEQREKALLESHITGVEASIREFGEPDFQLFPILRIYLSRFKAKVMGFSMGKSYNGLTELLMYSDLKTHCWKQGSLP